MIFITVGTHEQPFDRLLKCIDKLIEEGIISEEVVCQKGYTDYVPKNYKAEKLLPYDQMQQNYEKARIVITHGGPASFTAVLSLGKIPIVVPRKEELNEHVNNHQVEFSKEVAKRMNNIIVAETDEDIKNAIINYDNIVSEMSVVGNGNNNDFCNNLINIINDLF